MSGDFDLLNVGQIGLPNVRSVNLQNFGLSRPAKCRITSLKNVESQARQNVRLFDLPIVGQLEPKNVRSLDPKVGRVAQSVYRLATDWMVRGSNPGGGR